MHLSLGEQQNFKFKQIDTPYHWNLNAIAYSCHYDISMSNYQHKYKQRTKIKFREPITFEYRCIKL